MSCTWERLHDLEESVHILAQVVERSTTVLASDGVMNGLPQALDAIDPWVVDRLEEQRDIRMSLQPLRQHIGLVDDVAVEIQGQRRDDDETAAAPVSCALRL